MRLDHLLSREITLMAHHSIEIALERLSRINQDRLWLEVIEKVNHLGEQYSVCRALLPCKHLESCIANK